MEGVVPAMQQPFNAASQARNYMHTNESQKDDAEQLVRETASQLEQKNITLIAVIESIGEYMRDEDSTIRSKSLNYLAGILEHTPSKTLSRQQVDVICTFLNQRIEDGGAVEGLLALHTSSRFSGDMAITTTRAILENLQDIQTRPQKQRYSIIRLVHDLLGNHRDAIKTMGTEFLVGIIDLFGGEKDPRNLMLVFSVVYVVAMEWDLSNHAESLFDSIFCYYPITFRPPPNDPYRITAQDLKQRLRRCIAASSRFGEYAFPQLLEKLDSGSPNIKRDVFDTLTACIGTYSPQVLAQHSNKIWDSLKYEVFHAQEEDLADEALKVIQANSARLCIDLADNDDGMKFVKKYLDTISKECLEKLREPQHKQAKYASRILAALGLSSHRALDEIIKAIFPSLISLYQGAETIESRRSFLECFLIILEAAVDVFRAQPRSRMDDIPLGQFKDTLMQRFSQALMATTADEMSYRILALSCLAKLSNIPGILSDEEVGLAVQYFNEIVLTEDADGRPDLVNKAIDTLLELSDSRSQVLLDVTVPKLLTELPDTGSTDIRQYQRSISILARLSTKTELSDTVVRRLFGRLDAALNNAAPPQYCEALLAALTYAIKSQRPTQASIGEKYAQKATDLIKRSGEAAIAGVPSPLTNIGVLKAVGRLVCLIIQTTHDSARANFSNEVYTLFNNEFVITDDQHSTVTRQQSIILSTYILAAINDKLTSPLRYATDNRPILEDLVAITLASEEPDIQSALLQHMTLLVNKFADSNGLVTAWNTCRNIGPAHSHGTTSPIKIKILVFLAKAQILRMSNTKALLDHLFGLLETEDCGALVATGFEILLSQDEILTKHNGAKIRLLSGQVVFTQLLSHITKMFPLAAPGVRPRYLIALGGILKHVDRQLALSHMKELNPLLLQSLSVPEPVLKGAVISILAIAISESPSLVEEHLSSIITQLLEIATNKTTNEASLRFKAMQCLTMIPGKFKEFILIPHTRMVDRGVMKVLDDPRRDVRKAAVDCRTAWLALDEPDEDD